MDDEVKTLRK